MRHTLKLHGVVVGWSDLEKIEVGLGRAHGAFRPGVGYELVEPIFRLFAQAVPRDGARDESKLARYHKSRDALALEPYDGAGQRSTTSAHRIVDPTSAAATAPLELDVLISDDGYWRRRTQPSVL